MREKTVIPEPEIHFSVSTTLMVMAIELYQAESERQFFHYVCHLCSSKTGSICGEQEADDS